MDLNNLRGSKWNLDVAEHYARPDAFKLTVRQDIALMIGSEKIEEFEGEEERTLKKE